jgi:hypothetical protein
MKPLNIRHWDLALIGIKKIPKNLVKTKTNILMKGNNWHDHTFSWWMVSITGDSFNLPEWEFIFWYFVAKNTILFHEDHWNTIVWNTRSCNIPDGIYELRKQVEFTAEGMRAVVD